MARNRKGNPTLATTYLWQYSEERAKAISPTFYARWLSCRESKPDKFVPEAICFF